MKEKIIYLEIDEELTSIVDRLRKIEERKVFLVIPKRANVSQSIVNLRLLKRQCELLDKEVIIVTADRISRNLASQVSFTVYQKIPEKGAELPEREAGLPKEAKLPEEEVYEIEAGKEISPPKPSFEISYSAPRYIEPKVRYKKEMKKEVLSLGKKKFEEISPAPLKVEEKPKPQKIAFKKISRKYLFLSGLFFLFLFLFAFFFFFHKATLYLYPKTQVLLKDFRLTTKDGLNEKDLTQGAIPGEIISTELEETKQFSATGKENIGGRAKGTITVYNEGSTDPQILVAGTRFISSGGLIFRSTSQITVPGFTKKPGEPIKPGTTNVSVIADQPGEAYNIGASSFALPGLPSEKQKEIYGKSSASMTGGYSKEITVVSSKDLTTAKKNLTQSLSQTGQNELKDKVSPGKVLVEGAIKSDILETTSSPEVGKEASKFNLKVKMRFWTIIFSKNEIEAFFEEKFKLDTKNQEIIKDKTIFQYQPINLDYSKKEILFKVQTKAFLTTKIDQEKIKKELTFKDKNKAKDYLSSLSEMKKVEITTFPSFFPRLPLISSNIKISLEVEK